MRWERDCVRGDRPFDFWKQYSSTKLTQLCRQFGLPHGGTIDEKSARLFVAWEAGYEPHYSVSFEESLKEDYAAKLSFNNGTIIIPDPKNIYQLQWTREPDSFLDVPSSFTLVTVYQYHQNSGSKDSQLNNFECFLNSDAFKLFQGGHVKNLYSFKVDGTDLVIFKLACAAEMSAGDEKEVWFVVEVPSAKIVSAFCSCMAGMSGACKHLFACFFKLEFIVRSGMNNPTVTDGERQWGLPSTRDFTAPQLVKELDWIQHVFGKQPAYLMNPPKKQAYVAVVVEPATSLAVINRFINDLKSNLPSAVIIDSLAPSAEEEDALCMYLDELKHSHADHHAVIQDLRARFGGEGEKVRLEERTRQHSRNGSQWASSKDGNERWLTHRRNRITASFAHGIFRKSLAIRPFLIGKTEAEKVLLRPNLLTTTIMDQLYGIQNFARLPRPLEYGRDNEETALQAYLRQTTLDKTCPHFKVERPGLVIDPKRPYLGATPDAIVGCDCHERRLVEIKCPYSCSGEKKTHDVTIDKAKFWRWTGKHEGDGVQLLNQQNQYFTQVQMQMALTGIHECDFYAWCPLGLGNGVQKDPELIIFDPVLWGKVLDGLSLVYEDVFLPLHLS